MAAIDRNAVIAAVEALLGPHAGDRQLAPFPDTAREFQEKYLKSKHGAWLIGYAGSRRARGPEGAKLKARTYALDVTVLTRKLSGAEGALGDLTSIEDVLDLERFTLGGLGYEVECGSDRFIGESESVWQFIHRVIVSPL